MIRLKHILLEEKQIPNVLFISDNGTDKRKGYARKLISSGVITGEIHTADKQPADELVALVYYHIASGYYDAVVIECSGYLMIMQKMLYLVYKILMIYVNVKKFSQFLLNCQPISLLLQMSILLLIEEKLITGYPIKYTLIYQNYEMIYILLKAECV